MLSRLSFSSHISSLGFRSSLVPCPSTLVVASPLVASRRLQKLPTSIAGTEPRIPGFCGVSFRSACSVLRCPGDAVASIVHRTKNTVCRNDDKIIRGHARRMIEARLLRIGLGTYVLIVFFFFLYDRCERTVVRERDAFQTVSCSVQFVRCIIAAWPRLNALGRRFPRLCFRLTPKRPEHVAIRNRRSRRR